MEMIPIGYYPAVAVRVSGEDGDHIARFARTDKGNAQALLYFEVIEGEYKGTRLPAFLYFTRDAHARSVESLRYCGWKGDDITQLDKQALDQEVSIQVEHNEWEGKVRPRVGFINRAGGGAMKLNNPMSDGDMRAFAAKLKAAASRIASVDGKRVDRAASSAAPAASGARTEAPRNDDWGERYDGPPEDTRTPPAAGRQPGEDDIPF